MPAPSEEYGWHVFARAYSMQRRKKHGKGQQERRAAVYIALLARWIVDGQHRADPVGRYPRAFGFGIANAPDALREGSRRDGA